MLAQRQRSNLRRSPVRRPGARSGICLAAVALACARAWGADLHLNDLDYFETQGLSVLAYQNTFHPVFRDQKLGGHVSDGRGDDGALVGVDRGQ